MTHLGERLADFVFGELPANEMEEARRHLAQCGECGGQVREFERTRSLLKTSPDMDPPRQIVFEVERRTSVWRWLVPVGVAAAVLLAVLIAFPMQVQWNDSQLTIAFGNARTPAATEINGTPEYQRIAQDIRQLQAQLDYLDAQQRDVVKHNYQLASDLQRLSPRTGGEE